MEKDLQTKDDVISAIQLLTEVFDDAAITADYLKNVFEYHKGKKPLDILRAELDAKNDFDLNLP